MGNQTHLFRRGQILQWRRRVTRQSTGFVDIKLSLGTSDARLAAILSRKLSAESDTVMLQAAQNLITDAEARQWLAAVRDHERAKIDRLAVLQRSDSRDPAGDRRHDQARRAAWDHLASNGLHSAVPPETNALVADDVDLLRRDLSSESRRLIILRDFKELSGRDEVSALETLAIMDHYIQAKREAWTTAMPEEALPPKVMEPETAFPVADIPFAAPAEHSQPHVSEPDPHALPEEPGLDPDIFAVVERMNELKRSENIEEKTLRQYLSFARLFSTLTGIRDLRLVRQRHVMDFRMDLANLPKSWGKSPKDENATRDEIMARVASLPPEKVGLAVGTVNRHLENLKQILSHAADEDIEIDPKLNPTKLRRKDEVRDRDKRDAFSDDQLIKIYKHPVWQGSRSEWYQLEPGDEMFRNGTWWCPLIAAYTGARRNEIAGLQPDEIVDIDGVLCFDIKHNHLRRVKNAASVRLVPIHSHLLELGLLSHVKDMRLQKSPALFPDMGTPGGKIWGRNLGRHMREIVDTQLGTEGAGLSFHSYRHYVQNRLDNSGVDDKVVRDIIGHEGDDVHSRTYRKPTPVGILKEAIEVLPRVM